MKRSILLLLISFSLFACQKEFSADDANGGGNSNQNSTYYIRCKINGTERSFNYMSQALITDFSGFKSLSLMGSAKANASSGEGVNFAINFTTGGPEVATYSEDDPSTDFLVAGVYNSGSTTIVYGAGIASPTVLPFSITITKIQSGEMTGTFKGAFYKQNLSTGELSSTDYLEFTDGAFRLPIK